MLSNAVFVRFLKTLFSFGGILFLASSPSAISSAAEIHGRIVGVTDGDTVTILDEQDNVSFRIRVSDIDAPERNQAFGQKAKEKLSDLVFQKQAIVRFTKIDQYGRVVGKVFVNGQDASMLMLEAGLAWHYKKYSDDKGYAEAEIQARKAGLGLWRDKEPLPPWEFRQRERQQSKVTK